MSQFQILLEGQNLLLNPGFEEFYECPTNVNPVGVKEIVPSWYSPTKGSPDYFNSCSKYNVSVPINVMGNVFAKEGQAYIGLVLCEKPDRIAKGKKQYFNYREYIQTELMQPLKKDCLYIVSYYYCIAPYTSFKINQLSICLTEKKINKEKHLFNCKTICGIDSSSIDNNTGTWIEVTDTIKANGGEKTLTIGNFVTDDKIIYKVPEYENLRNSLLQTIKLNGYAYYFIDMIKLIPYQQ